MKNLLADGRRGWEADNRLSRSRVAAKILIFVILFNFMFHEIFLPFREIQNNFVTICVSQNFGNAVLQPPYVGVELGGGLVQSWCTLRANADCPLFVFPLYCFPFCHL